MHPQYTPEQIAYFWSKVNKNGPVPEHRPELGSCWLWTGAPLKSGYGQHSIKRKKYRAHRFAYIITYGPLPPELYACHKCDTPLCCRPDHLWQGTAMDNSRDCRIKGRLATGDRNASRLYPERLARGDRSGARLHPERLARGDRSGSRLHPETRVRGERMWSVKLTEDDVRAMRAEYASGIGTYRLARKYGVSQPAAYAVVMRRTWKHIP